MILAVVFIISLLLILPIIYIVARAIIKKQQIIWRSPILVVYFLLAKMLVLVNLVFLLLKGLNINVYRIIIPVGYIDIIALVFLMIGTVILFLSTFKLDNDLVFVSSPSKNHKLQTKGIYSNSRYPFYLGFIFILFSSCLFNPYYKKYRSINWRTDHPPFYYDERSGFPQNPMR